ncbi:Lrp/AsnC ligand binding domain-containing protein [Thauera sinica]|uniref:Lrp/AsnC ligand binding domain-containing protein n=1 Tax=Thauera sinica TaxID=2665146 RepID=A0ABW1AXE3_9RHOO|nr:Lrp/AsnC ligand binding domain-containing protein [Thauera sp. K11]
MTLRALREGGRRAVAAFETAVADIPQIVGAQRLFGEPDHLFHVVAHDLPAFQQRYDEHLSTPPDVQRRTSTLVMKRVIQERCLPL